MYTRHEETSAPVNASAERIFDKLDDPTHLTESYAKWCTRQMVRATQHSFNE